MPETCTPPSGPEPRAAPPAPPPRAAAQRAREAGAAAGRLQDDLLAAVRAAVRAARALGVGEVLGRDVHAQALGAQGAGGDVEGAEEAHHFVPIADSSMSRRARATCTRAWYSRPFWAILADSASTSTPPPSARITSFCVLSAKVVVATVSRLPLAHAACSALWKSTSRGLKFGVLAFAMLDASALWRCAAPAIARSKPSWVVSNRSMRAGSFTRPSLDSFSTRPWVPSGSSARRRDT